jgi:ADP-heptose:LPS heptosyltransferase
VSAGPGERELALEVCKLAPRTRLLDGKELGLPRMIASYAAARVVVAADTGPLHLAAAVGTRVVALFGPKDARLYGPRGEGHAVLFRDVPCRPCTRRDCPSPQCVLGVSVDQAVTAVHALLEVGAAP